MAGVKRPHETMENEQTTTTSSPYIPLFEFVKTELDEHHDRRERVIKASRDITAFSKKVIFALQRSKGIGQPLTDKRALGDIERLKKQINETFVSVAPDLQGINAYRYQRNISGGIQEYMEAILFEHYLKTQSLMKHEEAAKMIPEGIILTYEDYALGLFDMTGELMKISITSMATHGKLPGREGGCSVLIDMQIIRTQLELMNVGGSYGLSKDYEQKLKVTRQSVEKVEASVYSMVVRGSERPKGWRPDVESDKRQGEEIESY